MESPQKEHQVITMGVPVQPAGGVAQPPTYAVAQPMPGYQVPPTYAVSQPMPGYQVPAMVAQPAGLTVAQPQYAAPQAPVPEKCCCLTVQQGIAFFAILDILVGISSAFVGISSAFLANVPYAVGCIAVGLLGLCGAYLRNKVCVLIFIWLKLIGTILGAIVFTILVAPYLGDSAVQAVLIPIIIVRYLQACLAIWTFVVGMKFVKEISMST